jgi:hypothetical protein
VHEAAEATDHTVRVVAPASAVLPDCRVKVAVRVGEEVLVVLVVLVIVTLPVVLSELLPVATTFSLPRVVVAQPVADVLRVAAPTPSVAVAFADQ